MKCVEADIDNGVRCLRCRNGNLECVFEESMRGKRSSKGKKSEIMAKNLKDMENTLDTVSPNEGHRASKFESREGSCNMASTNRTGPEVAA